VLRVADLADLAGMSPSSFHRHFRSATSMTPIQFQKQIRLQAARALLISSPGEVAEIGYRVGYESPQQGTRAAALVIAAVIGVVTAPSRLRTSRRRTSELPRGTSKARSC
jgi:transcriptional regulator GlxA family with amidase domain